MKTRVTIILVASLCFALVGSEFAVAKKANTTVELEQISEDRATGEGTYEGKVKSPKGKCKKRRKVTLIHNSDPPFTIGETITDENGNWTITGPLPPVGDKITVKVKSTTKCKGAEESYEYEG